MTPARIDDEARQVLDFWFGSPGSATDGQARAEWFRKSDAFDREIARRFAPLIERALTGRLRAWDAQPQSALARIVLLDQFTRNAFRDTPRAFAGDALALAAAQALVARGADATKVAGFRVFGAAAEAGAELDALQTLGTRVNGRTRSMGVALTSCTVPAAGKPTFELPEDEMEMGVGIHGEPGRRRVRLQAADAIAEEMVGAITADLAPSPSAEVLLLVNGFGATPAMELYLMYGRARRLLEAKGLVVARSLVGNYCTSLDMAGCSLTVTALDQELRQLWDAPAHTAALRW